MFKKIYNLMFSPKQRSYQQEAYEALSFWESYRGWLVMVFIVSWLVSILIFKISLWSVIFLAPFYALLLWLAYQGGTVAMIFLIVLWLMEKINNFAYLFFDYYKLLIFIILGLIFFSVAFQALKIEFIKSTKEGVLKNKKTFRTIKAVLTLVLFWLLGFLAYHYYPFIRQRADFSLDNKDSQTTISNNNFKISFALADNCSLDSDILNHLLDYSLWAGQLRCQKNGDFTVFVVSDDAVSHDWQPVEGLDGVFSYDRGPMWNIIITKPDSPERLVIGGYDYNKNMKNNIINSLKKI